MLDTPRHNDVEERSHSFTRPQPSRSFAEVGVQRLKTAAVALWPLRYLAPALAAIAAALWYAVIPALLGPVVIADPAVRADFVQTVVASGHVEAPFRVNIGSQITGVVADIPVVEGQTVRAGEILVRLDDREVRAAVVQAEGAGTGRCAPTPNERVYAAVRGAKLSAGASNACQCATGL